MEQKNLENEKEKNNKLDFNVGKIDDSVKIDPNTKRKLSFKSCESLVKEYTKKNEDGSPVLDEHGEPVLEKSRVLDFITDSVDGKQIEKPYRVTSKYLAASLQKYHEKGVLFKHIFEIERKGSGLQTKYFVFDEGEKQTGE